MKPFISQVASLLFLFGPATAGVITPSSVVSETAATDLFQASQLIDGSGLSNPAVTEANLGTVTHANSASNSWVTDDFLQSGDDYFAEGGPNPVLTFELPSIAGIDGVIYWGYGGIPGNEARTFRFTFLDVTGAPVGPVIERTAANPADNSANVFDIPLVAGVASVRVEITDNFFPQTGGDRVGLGEIKFRSAIHVVRESTAGAAADGSSWQKAYPKLQDALDEAGPGDSILVTRGTYYPDESLAGDSNDPQDRFVIPSGVALYGGFINGGGRRFIDRDPDLNKTILSGDIDQNDDIGDRSGNSIVVVESTGSDSTTFVDGFTITAGGASGGSGISCLDGAALSFFSCTISDNRSGFTAGGISSGNSSPFFLNCLITANHSGESGGGVSANGGSPEFSHCVFRGNSADGVGGAAADGGEIRFTGCHFIENTSNGGGGALARFSGSVAGAVTNCRFEGNRGRSGGAVFSLTATPYTNCSFSGNLATQEGGALYAGSTQAILVNCSLQGNRALTRGGALYSNSGSFTLSNCIVWNNARGDQSDIPEASVESAAGNPDSISHSLVQHLDLTGSNANLDGTDPGNDPLFLTEIEAASAPASGADLRVFGGSPVIDAGDLGLNGEALDLAGRARVAGSGIDFGAHEHQGILYVDTTATGSADGSSWANAFPELRQALGVLPSAQEIRVAAGTYHPTSGSDRTASFVLDSGDVILGGFPTGGGPLDSRDPLSNASSLSGDIGTVDVSSDNSHHVIIADNVDSFTRLDGLYITAAKGEGSGAPSQGGGLRCSGTAAPLVIDCAFFLNESVFGGAIYHADKSASRVVNVLFSGNVALAGGGAYSTDNSSPSFTNCVFRDNEANVGGVMVNTSSSAPLFTNCSFRGNRATAGNGGAVFSDSRSTPVFANCILWDNESSGQTDTSTASSFVGGLASPSFSHCLVANSGGSIAWDPAIGIDDGDNLDADPRFASDQDLRLLAGSPAVNTGDNDANPTLVDFNGQHRVRGGMIDLGAFERQPLHVDDDVAGGDGSSWPRAYASLEDALASAGAGDEIWVAEGSYRPSARTDAGDPRSATFSMLDGVKVFGGFGGGESIRTERDPSAFDSILSGDLDQNDSGPFVGTDANAYHVVTAIDVDAFACLDGFTVTAGNADASSPPDYDGGGLFASNTPMTVRNCRFLANSAAIEGGGVYSVSSNLAITNCLFAGNKSGSIGGGLSNRLNNSTVTNCVFRGNFSSDRAGAVYNGGSLPTLTNCSFSGNRSVNLGGAIYSTAGAKTSLVNCVFWNNSAAGQSGTPGASVAVSATTSTFSFSHCLVEGSGGSTSWNASFGTDLGNNIDVDPIFVTAVDPASAPTTLGELRVFSSSPVREAGDNGANNEPTDISGAMRIQDGTIDLGAYERFFAVTFAFLHPSLDPDGDENGNGIRNFDDYAMGSDPTAPADLSLLPVYDYPLFYYSVRNNASDVIVDLEYSADLKTWDPFNDLFFLENNKVVGASGDRIEILTLFSPPSTPRLYLRADYRSSPP